MSITDSAFLQPVQIRAADSDRGDSEKLFALRRTGNRFVVEPKIAFTVYAKDLQFFDSSTNCWLLNSQLSSPG